MKKQVEKRKRKPGGGRHTLYEGADLVKVTIRITEAQKAHLEARGDESNISDGARKVITHDMATKGKSDEA